MRGNRTLRYFSKYIKFLPQLSFKERYVLKKRLRMITLESIGEKFSVTESRIRQIERLALIKLKKKIYQPKLFSSKNK
jgi:DNA-directed RNA polymerase sigma subunit (sigma70/sigma32)